MSLTPSSKTVLTKADIVKSLMDQFGLLAKDEAVQLVEFFFEEIAQALERGEEVKLAGLGNFSVRRKKARPGRNPRTGEPVEVSARRVVTYHPSVKLKAGIDVSS